MFTTQHISPNEIDCATPGRYNIYLFEKYVTNEHLHELFEAVEGPPGARERARAERSMELIARSVTISNFEDVVRWLIWNEHLCVGENGRYVGEIDEEPVRLALRAFQVYFNPHLEPKDNEHMIARFRTIIGAAILKRWFTLPRKPWNEREDADLADHYAAGSTPSSIALVLNRSTQDVQMRLVHLGLMAKTPLASMMAENRAAGLYDTPDTNIPTTR